MSYLRAVAFDWGHTILDEDWGRELPLNTAPVKPMPGVIEALSRIKLSIAIWANTRSYLAADVELWLNRAEISKYFDCVVTSGDIK